MLNAKQIISITGAVLSALVVASAQFDVLVGPGMSKTIVSVAGIGNLIIQSVMATLTGQQATVKDVLAMPGIQHVEVNAKANKPLAELAVDPTVNKIAPSAAAQEIVEQTAKNGDYV